MQITLNQKLLTDYLQRDVNVLVKLGESRAKNARAENAYADAVLGCLTLLYAACNYPATRDAFEFMLMDLFKIDPCSAYWIARFMKFHV